MGEMKCRLPSLLPLPLWATLCYTGLSASGVADVVTPVNVYASSYYGNSNTTPAQAINGSGLSNTPGLSLLEQTHAAPGDGFGSWIATSGPGLNGAATIANQYLLFDLGANYTLTTAYLWQFVQGTLIDRGLNEFRLFGSSALPTPFNPANPPTPFDLSGFTEILSLSELEIGTANTRSQAQAFTLSGATNVRQIYLQVVSTHGGTTTGYTGLSEIRFEGLKLSPPPTRWTNATGGSWATPGNWSSGATPSGYMNATFDLEASYAISTPEAVQVDEITVSAGEVSFTSTSGLLAKTLRIDGGHLISNTHAGNGTTLVAGNFRYDQLEFTDGTLELRTSVFTPRRSTISTGGVNFTNAWEINGEIGAEARPRLLLVGSHINLAIGLTAPIIGRDGGKAALEVVGQNATFNTSGGTAVVGSGTTTIEGVVHRGDGLLTLRGGATGTVGDFRVGVHGGRGTANIDGEGTTLHANGTYYIGSWRDGSGTLNVTNGAKITTNSAIMLGVYGGTGSILLSGSGSHINAGPGISIGEGVSGPARAFGTLEIRNGAVFETVVFRVGTGGGNGAATIGAADGTDTGETRLSVGGRINLGFSTATTATMEINHGAFVETVGGVFSEPNDYNSPGIYLNLNGGILKTPSIFADVNTHFLNWSGGTLWLTGGTVDATRNANTPVTMGAEGKLIGHGAFRNNIRALGEINPGDADTPFGKFVFRNGLTAGNEQERAEFVMNLRFGIFDADEIEVQGAVSLENAGLRLTLEDPTPGTMENPIAFLLITNDGTDAVNGRFTFVDLGAEYEDLFFYIDYAFSGTAVNGIGTGNDIAIVFIPEPSTWLLFTSASVGLLLLRRRRSAVARSETLCA